jgi:hypothetical protein
MRHRRSGMVLASAFIAALGGAAVHAQQPTSEGHPHKWIIVDKSMADLVADGYELTTVVYDTSETAPKAEPDVHYFLQKGTSVVRCDFRKREEASIYWCSQLTAGKG